MYSKETGCFGVGRDVGIYMKSQKIETSTISEHKTAPSLREREMIANAETADLQQVSVKKQDDRQITPITQEEPNTALLAATGGLAVILGQLVAYFYNRAHIDDLDVLSFSLHHLFCRIDHLYETALPRLAALSQSEARPGAPNEYEISTSQAARSDGRRSVR